MKNFLARAWAEINIDHLLDNYKAIKNRLDKNVKFMAVVKADAYGHGVEYIAPALDKAGADWFAVSNLEEALQLRSLGIKKPVLILGYTPVDCADLLFEHKITQTVLNAEYAKELSLAAQKNGRTLNVHIKVDTGMGRIGFVCHKPEVCQAAAEEIRSIASLPGLYAEGIFTHFTSSDLDGDADGQYTKEQFNLFMSVIDALEQKGVTFALRHCCNSAAVLNNPDMQLDIVRPGIILYGLEPSRQLRERAADLKPVMSLKAVASMIKTTDIGDTFSYGRTYTAKEKTTVATVPIGYADGYPRCLGNKGYLMVSGKRCPILGRVCMDQLMIDVTGAGDIKPGSEVLLFGRDKNGALPVEEIASIAGTINYETVCLIGKRVPRIFYLRDKEIGYLNYIYNK